jgi:hypothetical protein
VIVIEDQRAQITRRFQPQQIGDVPGNGGKVGQIEQVLLGQRPGRFSQRLADGGVQTRVGNGDLLRQGRGDKAAWRQYGQHQRTDDLENGSHEKCI